jgi:hypothetical protein
VNERYLEHNGKKQSIKAWAEELGLSPSILYRRLSAGFSVERTLVGKRLKCGNKRKFTPEVEEEICQQYREGKTVSQLGNEYKVHSQLICKVLKRCGVPARGIWRENSTNWKGGRVVHPRGYVRILIDNNHPFASMGQKVKYKGKEVGSLYVLEHRLVMAEYLGRPLIESETVHHINGKTGDNRLCNLQLRIGNHGGGQVYCCADCGSRRLNPVPLD